MGLFPVRFRPRRGFLFSFALALFGALVSFPNVARASSEVEGVVAMSGADPDLPSAELKVLDPLVRGAKIVAIGESAHGSANYLKMIHRVTQYLVEKKGFRLVVLENPVIRSAGLTEWVEGCATGKSKGKKLPIDLLYMPHEEDWNFFVWMCEFNRAHRRDPVRFRGMDVWDRPWEHQARMETLSRRWKLPFDAELLVARKHCWYHGDSDWSNDERYMKILQQEKRIPAADYDPCIGALGQMERAVDRRLSRPVSDREYYDLHSFQQSVQTSIGFLGNYHWAYRSFGKRWNSRDLAQAKNVYSMWEQEGELRTVLIAHTTHTSKMESPSDWWKTGKGEFKTGVYFLKQWLGKSIRTIGLTGYDVTGSQGEWAKPTSPNSLDLELHLRGYSAAFVDPYSKFVRSRERWWVHNENHKDHYVDGVYLVPRDNFDAFFFFDVSHRGKPILPYRNVWRW